MDARVSVTECQDLKTGPTPVASGGAVEAASISNYQGFTAPLSRMLSRGDAAVQVAVAAANRGQIASGADEL